MLPIFQKNCPLIKKMPNNYKDMDYTLVNLKKFNVSLNCRITPCIVKYCFVTVISPPKTHLATNHLATKQSRFATDHSMK